MKVKGFVTRRVYGAGWRVRNCWTARGVWACPSAALRAGLRAR